jgi:hypothetical protein
MDYNISVLGGYRQSLARTAAVLQAPRVTVGGQIRLVFLPGRKFSTHLDVDAFRGAAPATWVATRQELNFNRFDARGQLAFYIRPGGGRLSLGLGYRFQFLRFEHQVAERGNRVVNGLMHETKWRFLPRSSVLLSYTMDFTYYFSCCAEIGSGRKEDNYAHRLLVGYRGQAFKKWAFELLVGWGGARYYQDPTPFDWKLDTFIGNAGMNYYPTLRSYVHVGLYRSFQDSLFGNFYVDTGGRIALGHQFRWRMIGHIGASVAARRYRGLPVPNAASDDAGPVEDVDIELYTGSGADRMQMRTVVATGEFKLEQPLGKVFSIALGYNLLIDNNNTTVVYADGPDDGDEPDTIDQLGFVKHLAMLLLSVRI